MGSEIHINMYDDRLEIISPGGMYAGQAIQESNISEINSVRRNPIIADLFHRIKFMERRGSGLKKIITETAKLTGYTDEFVPYFYSVPTSFFVTLKSINYAIIQYTIQDSEQDNILKEQIKQKSVKTGGHDSGHDKNLRKLIEFCTEPKTREEMQTYLKIASRDYFSNNYLKPLINSGDIKMTIPDKPKSKYQKYIRS